MKQATFLMQLRPAATPAAQTWQSCELCGHPAFDDSICGECRDEMRFVDTWQQRREASRALRQARPAARRLENWAYAAATLAVFWHLLWEFRGFFIDCLRLWFGGK